MWGGGRFFGGVQPIKKNTFWGISEATKLRVFPRCRALSAKSLDGPVEDFLFLLRGPGCVAGGGRKGMETKSSLKDGEAAAGRTALGDG